MSLCRMFEFTHHFVIVSRRFFSVHQRVCVVSFNVSLVVGAIHHFVIVWVVFVFCVCMSCVRFGTDVVEVLLLLRVACVCVVQPK